MRQQYGGSIIIIIQRLPWNPSPAFSLQVLQRTLSMSMKT